MILSKPLVPAFPLLPTGSLIETDSKFGHELIAGPVVHGQQVVLHKEPGIGNHAESVASAAQRYRFTRVQLPVNGYHGALSLLRMEQKLGEPWAPLDNCQHAAREAYFGVRDSPTVNGIALGASLLLLWLTARS